MQVMLRMVAALWQRAQRRMAELDASDSATPDALAEPVADLRRAAGAALYLANDLWPLAHDATGHKGACSTCAHPLLRLRVASHVQRQS